MWVVAGLTLLVTASETLIAGIVAVLLLVVSVRGGIKLARGDPQEGGDLSRPYLWLGVIGGLILSASALAIALGLVER